MDDTIIILNEDQAEKALKRYEQQLEKVWKEGAAPPELCAYERGRWHELRKSWASRDKAHNWDGHVLGQLGVKRIFEAYFDLRIMRLSAAGCTQAEYAAIDRGNMSDLTSPEMRIYREFEEKLEQLVPNPQWRRDEETKLRRPAPEPVG